RPYAYLQNVLGRIHITVFDQTTGRAEMRPHAQTFLDVLPTPATLLRRKARRNPYHHMTGSFSLIREDSEKCAPTGVVNTLREMMVLHHPGDIQVFDTETAILLGIVLGGLEMEV